MISKHYFFNGPLCGQVRATGACNPWRVRGKRGIDVYHLHVYGTGDSRYGIYVLAGHEPPTPAAVRGFIDTHHLEPMP